jgi:hypothetical protein
MGDKEIPIVIPPLLLKEPIFPRKIMWFSNKLPAVP